MKCIYKRPPFALVAFLPLLIVIPGCGKTSEPETHDHEDHDQKHSQASSEPETTTAAVRNDDYPLTTCLVSGEPLDAMGGHVSVQHEGHEVRFCCKSCVKEFNKEPTKYLAMLNKAAAGELPLEHDTTKHKHDDHNH